MTLFPFVPMLPGVPPVFRNATNNNIQPVPGAVSDGPGVSTAANVTPQWGIYNSDGNQVLVPDSVVALDDFLHEFIVSDFPIEEGSFGSFNKVAKPFEGRFIFNKGGTQADRSEFLDILEAIVRDLELYTLVTPEIVYPNVNVQAYRYRRRADNGYQLISVEIRLVEIRVAASPQFSNTQDPTQNPVVNGGAIQAQVPNGAQTAQAQGDLAGAPGVGPVGSGTPGGN